MAQKKGLGWLLDDLTQRVSFVRHALVLSNDGLVTGASSGLAREDAEHLAAVSSGLHSLAKGSGQHFRAAWGAADDDRVRRRGPLRDRRG